MNDDDVPQYCDDSEGNLLVGQQMAIAVKRIQQIAGPQAIILGGSYGRGEGAIRRMPDGRIRGVNDYDLCCVWDEIPGLLSRKMLKRLAGKLAAEFEIRHVDIISTTAEELSRVPPSLMAIDLTYGGIFLYGDQTVLDSVQWQPGNEVFRGEILNLLLNRMVTLLEGHPDLGEVVTAQQRARQIAKVMWAIVDSRCNAHMKYRTHYRDKLAIMHELSQSDAHLREISGHAEWLEQAWTGSITEAFAHTTLPTAWDFTRNLLVAEIADTVNRKGGGTADTLETVFSLWRGGSTAPHSALRKSIRRALTIFGRCSKPEVEKALYAALTAYPHRQNFHGLGLTVPEGGSLPWRLFIANLVHDWYDSFHD